MTVVSVKRIGDGQGGNIQGPHQSSITLAYRVITNNPLDTPAEVRLGLPYLWGDNLPGTGLMCQGESYDFQSKGPGQSVWNVSLEFSSVSIDQEEREREENPNPLDRRARITVRSVRYSELTIRDRDGNIKRTSAGEIYEPKEKDATRWTVHVRKNYSAIPDFVWTYQNKLNAAPVNIKGRTIEKETLKFSEVTVPELQVENNVEFYAVEFELDYREPGEEGFPWRDRRVDAGFYYLDGTDLKPILDDQDDPEPITVEEWLDGSGGRLRDTISNPQPGDETINEFEDYQTADFSMLPLNES